MSNYQDIGNLIEELTGQKGWTTGACIKIAGNPMAGLLLDRIIWWSDKGNRPDGFFWKSAQDWQDELGFSYANLTTAAKILTGAGFISKKLRKANGFPTTHYRAEIEAIRQKVIEEYSNYGYANLDIPEIEETRNSENSETEIRESEKTKEIQESSISITELTITNNITNEADATPRKRKMPEVIPSHKIHAEETGSYCLNKKQIKTIQEVIGTDPPKLERWREVCHAWAMQANKPNNLTGLLNWFNNGIPDYAREGYQNNGRSQGNRQTGDSVSGSTAEASKLGEQLSAAFKSRARTAGG